MLQDFDNFTHPATHHSSKMTTCKKKDIVDVFDEMRTKKMQNTSEETTKHRIIPN